MMTVLMLAATLAYDAPKNMDGSTYTNGGFVAGVGVPKASRKREEPETPVDQWHKFARGGKVEFQKDTRPKQYKKEEVEYKDRPPRKPQPKKSVRKGEKK